MSKKLTIQGLTTPVAKSNKVVGSRPVSIGISEDESDSEFSKLLQDALGSWWLGEKGDTLPRREFQSKCVLPYIHGRWLDSDHLLRTPQMIGREAIDKLLRMPDESLGWPVYYPADQPHVAEFIRANNQHKIDLDLRPLPTPRPHPATEEGNNLYNQPGFLFLPNAYVVPGGAFSEMYGWDSCFIILGILASAEYILKHEGCYILDESQYRPSTHEDVQRLFQLAKGMVDNHIYEIRCYGGYVLNGNRAYYLTRSQPPLFTRQALAVYEFAMKYGEEVDLPYIETLAHCLYPDDKERIVPTSYDDWMRKQVVPAATSYYYYWTDPELVFADWDPRGVHIKGQNPRVVRITPDGDYVEGAEKESWVAYRYYPDGDGASPEVVNGMQDQNKQLYLDAARFFREFPEENPMDPRTGRPMFWDPKCSNFANLTQEFFCADRAVRASGFDLSGRYGAQGQYATNYAPVDLNTLLFQMGSDLLLMYHRFGSDYHSQEESKVIREQIRERVENARFVINNLLWQDEGEGGSFRDLRIHKIGTAPKKTYAYSTTFVPLWAKGLINDPEKRKRVLRGAAQTEVVTQDQIFHKTDDTVVWIKDNPGEIFRQVDGAGEFCKIEAGSTSLISLTKSEQPWSYGIPTSSIHSGNQWDFPYSWAPIQHFAVEGLWETAIKDGGEALQAVRNIIEGWVDAVDIVFAQSGNLVEKYTSYDPADYESVARGYAEAEVGFGWTNAVYLRFLLQAEERLGDLFGEES